MECEYDDISIFQNQCWYRYCDNIVHELFCDVIIQGSANAQTTITL